MLRRGQERRQRAVALSKVDCGVRFDQPNRHPHDVAYRPRFDNEVMLQASRPPNPRAVVKDDETQPATDMQWSNRLSALKHPRPPWQFG